MKWKFDLIAIAIITIQLLFIALLMFSSLVINEYAVLATVVGTFIIASIGSIIIMNLSSKETIENKYITNTIKIVLSLLSTLLVFIAFFPIMAVLKHSSLSAVALSISFIAPYLTYRIKLKRVKQAHA